jgi:uncharacterized protein (DUF1697 family)
LHAFQKLRLPAAPGLGYPEPEMPVIVSLLRGINVGGNNQIRMDALRRLYESLGMGRVETFIQSGNVICTTKARDLARLTSRIEDAIEQSFGFRCGVVLRTASELHDAVARNPFAARPGIDPARLLVTFLGADPDPEGCRKVLAMAAGNEEVRVDGRHVYLYFPDGIARTQLTWALIGKTMKTSATARNWNTVQKLLEIAGRLEVSP